MSTPGDLPGRARIPELDGLRALAALAVIFVHFGPAPLVTSAHSFFAFQRALDALSLANLAVTLFYALSAFLLTYLGVREFDSSGSFDVKRFYLRRGFRIWPLYFSILVIDLVLAAPSGPLAPRHAVGSPQWPGSRATSGCSQAFCQTGASRSITLEPT